MTATHNRIDWNSVRQRLERFQVHEGKPTLDDRERLRKVFHQRAELLAARGRDESTQAGQTSCIVFRLGNNRFGVELASVKQVFPPVPITPIPGMDQYLLGIANLNGSLRSIVNLRVLVSLPAMESDAGFIILLRASDKLLGIWAETIEGISQIDLTRLSATDEAESDTIGKLTTGISDDRILLLDATRLIEHVAEQRRLHTNNQ